MWKGWQPYDTTFDFGGIGDPLGGACRSLHRHVDISNTTWVSVGCAHRFYMWRDGTSHEVTPVQSTQAGLSNPFATTNGSSIVTVTDTSHGQIQGNIVVFSGASTVASILDTTINRTQGWSIASTVDANSYTIDFGTSASATTSGGGTVTATYLIQPGSDDAVAGGGWGSLSWGEEEWGGDDALSIGERLGIWSQDNWGEDLVANPQGGAIYYWDATSPSARMVNILNLGSADGFAPISADFILVSYESRQLIAFGATEYSSGTANHMNIRWSDQEDILTWNDAATTNAAGSKALALGTKLISAIHGTGDIVVWSDTTTYSMKFIGAPYMFSFDIIEQTSDIIGLKACATLGSTVFWVGRSGVYAYSGRVQKLECPVWDYLDSRCNWQQASKVIACTNRLYNEVLFFYPSSDGNEIDSYIAFDVNQNVWTIGSLVRTAWLDMSSLAPPIGAGSDGALYTHEVGGLDGSDNSVLDAYIESSPIELSSEGAYDKGDRFMFIRRILPDVSFRNYSGASPQMKIVLKMMDKPGGGIIDQTPSGQVDRSATIPVEEFTEELHVRLRGRAMIFRAENGMNDSQWRLGTPRIDVRPDGQR
jgi:hypothetical protein